MFVSKVRLSPLIYWFVNFTLADKYGTQNFIGTYPPLKYSLSTLICGFNQFKEQQLWLPTRHNPIICKSQKEESV